MKNVTEIVTVTGTAIAQSGTGPSGPIETASETGSPVRTEIGSRARTETGSHALRGTGSRAPSENHETASGIVRGSLGEKENAREKLHLIVTASGLKEPRAATRRLETIIPFAVRECSVL